MLRRTTYYGWHTYLQTKGGMQGWMAKSEEKKTHHWNGVAKINIDPKKKSQGTSSRVRQGKKQICTHAWPFLFFSTPSSHTGWRKREWVRPELEREGPQTSKKVRSKHTVVSSNRWHVHRTGAVPSYTCVLGPSGFRAVWGKWWDRHVLIWGMSMPSEKKNESRHITTIICGLSRRHPLWLLET